MSVAIDQLAITADDRVLITGASGWMGREIAHTLMAAAPNLPILGVGSRDPGLRLTPELQLNVVAWDPGRVATWEPTIAIHLAFKTRNLLDELGIDDDVSKNRRLRDQAAGRYSLRSLRSMVLTISGTAGRAAAGVYGDLRLEDEKRLAQLGEQHGVPTLVARIWSVAGAHCTKPNRFALYDLIRQTSEDPEIHITAPHRVERRYVDAGQYLAVCLAAANLGWSGAIDSAGDLVELADLARTVQAAVGTTKEVVRPAASGPADSYYSDSTDLATWAGRIGATLSSLDAQVVTSAAAVGVRAVPRRLT